MAPALARVNPEDEGIKQLILQALEVIRSDDFDRYFDLFTEQHPLPIARAAGDRHRHELHAEAVDEGPLLAGQLEGVAVDLGGVWCGRGLGD